MPAPTHPLLPLLTPTGGSLVYSALMAVSLAAGAIAWTRRTRNNATQIPVYLGAVVGALLGAKLGFLLAEGWTFLGDDRRWAAWLSGKTVVGALLGGYAGVEVGKRMAGLREPTGDFFALAVPAGLVLGRIGCHAHGCCTGVACAWAPGGVWPAATVELLFNTLAFAVLLVLHRRRVQPGQLFHLYLVAYGVFRLLHEPMRATPKLGDSGVAAWLSPYQLLAAGLVVLGVWRFGVRRRMTACTRTPAPRP